MSAAKSPRCARATASTKPRSAGISACPGTNSRRSPDDPLVTIGAHSITHCNLAKQSEEIAHQEMAISRARIEDALQRPVLHLAYPYGDRTAAGPREFALARAAGFKTAVTTRPGMLFPESADHLTALPRVSLNGNYQDDAHPAGADLRRGHRDVERFQARRRGVDLLHSSSLPVSP